MLTSDFGVCGIFPVLMVLEQLLADFVMTGSFDNVAEFQLPHWETECPLQQSAAHKFCVPHVSHEIKRPAPKHE